GGPILASPTGGQAGHRRPIMKAMMFGLALTALCAHATEALAAVVQLTNGAGRRLCVAKTESTYSTGATTYVNEGWSCIEPRESLKIPLTVALYVTITDDAGRDYVDGNQLANYISSYQAYVPAEPTDKFGVKFSAFNGGGYSYSYFLGD